MSTRMRAILSNPNGVYYGGVAYQQIEQAFNDMVNRGLTVSAKPNPPQSRYRRCKTMLKSLRGWGLRLFREPRNTPMKKSLYGQTIFNKYGYWPKSKRQKEFERARDRARMNRTRTELGLRSSPPQTSTGRWTSREPNIAQSARLTVDPGTERINGAAQILNEPAMRGTTLAQAAREWDRRQAQQTWAVPSGLQAGQTSPAPVAPDPEGFFS